MGADEDQAADLRVDALFDRAPESLLTLSVRRPDDDVVRFRIESANEAVATLAERPVDSLIGADPATALPFMRESGLLNLCTDVVESGRDEGRELLVADGHRRWFEIGVTFERGLLSLSMRDVDVRHRALAGWARAERRLETILAQMGRVAFEADGREDGSWVVTHLNDGLDGLAGGRLDRGGNVAEAWAELVVSEDRERYDENDRALQDEGRHVAEYRVRGLDGVVRHVRSECLTERSDDGVLKVAGILSDVGDDVRTRTAVRELADEQSALRHVATAVAKGLEPSAVFRLVAEKAASLLDADRSVVMHGAGSDAVPVGAWSRGVLGPTSELALEGPSTLSAQITVAGAPWGVIAAGWSEPHDVTPGARERLGRFAELVAAAVANAEARERLANEALTDPVTGLVNHRGFHARLREAVAHARRHDRPLSLVLFDLDDFKRVNDHSGHQVGDRVLRALARRLEEGARDDEPPARLGGDEFGLLLPDADGRQGTIAAERICRLVAARPVAGHDLTISVGVCDLARAADADDLCRLADGALYWAKAHGRNGVWLYTPEVVEELSAQERAESLARSRALAGIEALARAIDARDPSTLQHSERVARLAVLLARTLGWSAPQMVRLEEAARIHDVGKIGVRDAVLRKPGPLTAAEFEHVKEHAQLGATIVGDVLEADQVSWIGAHHERPDGAGYPRGLRAAEITSGAALLALADAWDSMTSDRPYHTGMSVESAMAECRRGAARQFTPAAVAALEELWRGGLLLAPEARADGAVPSAAGAR